MCSYTWSFEKLVLQELGSGLKHELQAGLGEGNRRHSRKQEAMGGKQGSRDSMVVPVEMRIPT